MREISSRDSQAKLIVRPVVKWREFRGKNCDRSDLLRKTHTRLTQCSKPVKNRKNPFFYLFVQIWTDLNGCRQRLLFTRQLIHRKCIASARRVTKHGNHSGAKAFKHSPVDVHGVGLDEMTTGKVKRKNIEKKKKPRPYLQKNLYFTWLILKYGFRLSVNSEGKRKKRGLGILAHLPHFQQPLGQKRKLKVFYLG